MNNKITEDYVSFEVAKLLKEKGFAVGSDHSFNPTTNEPQNISSLNSILPAIERPTHSLAIKWMRENFGIHISSEYNYGTKLWEYTITFVEDSQKTYELIDKLGILAPEFNSPEEATEAALRYTLKNLV